MTTSTTPVTGNPTMLGYSRVSTDLQSPDLQDRALMDAGCWRIWTDHGISGTKMSRPALDDLLEALRPGDTIVVWRLDRLGRSLSHLLELISELEARRVHFRSLTEGMDTTTPAGRLLFTLVGALAAFERDVLVERTVAGMEAARARGSRIGRPTVLDPERLDAARQLLAGGMAMGRVAKTLGVGRSSLYRAGLTA